MFHTVDMKILAQIMVHNGKPSVFNVSKNCPLRAATYHRVLSCMSIQRNMKEIGENRVPTFPRKCVCMSERATLMTLHCRALVHTLSSSSQQPKIHDFASRDHGSCFFSIKTVIAV